MYNIKPSTPLNNYMKSGMHAGYIRASTGYSFLPIQRFTANVSQKIIKGEKLTKVDPIPCLYRLMDSIFLYVFIHNKNKRIMLFESMAKHLKPDQFARFMTEQATFYDILRIITIMPKRIFLKACLMLVSRLLRSKIRK